MRASAIPQSPLTFKLKQKPEFLVDLSALIPDKLAGLSHDEIQQLRIKHGRDDIPVGELFVVEGNDHTRIVLRHGHAKFAYVGKTMSHGCIHVLGDVGDYLGQSMQGGYIEISGNAGSLLGSNMRNGHINIQGNAGDYVASAMPGEQIGMYNGIITIYGNAGDRVGDHMRRGIILIKGNAGEYCGARLYAGTIIVLGKIARYPGTMMQRGTIISTQKQIHIPKTFKNCGMLNMPFLNLLFLQLVKIHQTFDLLQGYHTTVRRFSGDLTKNGKGEILILQNEW